MKRPSLTLRKPAQRDNAAIQAFIDGSDAPSPSSPALALLPSADDNAEGAGRDADNAAVADPSTPGALLEEHREDHATRHDVAPVAEDLAPRSKATRPPRRAEATPPLETLSFRRAARAVQARKTKPNRRRATVYFDIDVTRVLAQHCIDHDAEMSTVVNEAVRQYLARAGR